MPAGRKPAAAGLRRSLASRRRGAGAVRLSGLCGRKRGVVATAVAPVCGLPRPMCHNSPDLCNDSPDLCNDSPGLSHNSLGLCHTSPIGPPSSRISVTTPKNTDKEGPPTVAPPKPIADRGPHGPFSARPDRQADPLSIATPDARSSDAARPAVAALPAFGFGLLPRARVENRRNGLKQGVSAVEFPRLSDDRSPVVA